MHPGKVSLERFVMGEVLEASLDIAHEWPNRFMLDADVVEQVSSLGEDFVASKHITHEACSGREMRLKVPLKVMLDLEGFAALIA